MENMILGMIIKNLEVRGINAWVEGSEIVTRDVNGNERVIYAGHNIQFNNSYVKGYLQDIVTVDGVWL